MSFFIVHCANQHVDTRKTKSKNHGSCFVNEAQFKHSRLNVIFKSNTQAWTNNPHKVEGAKTNTYERLPIANTLRPWTVPSGVGVLGPTEWCF